MCGIVNLHAGIESGIEGSIHAVREWEDLGRGETSKYCRRILKHNEEETGDTSEEKKR